MAFGVFMHRSDSIYDDDPAAHYQFPASYRSRAEACVGDWIVYLEPGKVRDTRGYFAVAKVRAIVGDDGAPNMFRALIEPGSYLPFSLPVPFRGLDGHAEQGVLNAAGGISGRAQSAVRPISAADFGRILDRAFDGDTMSPPRTGTGTAPPGFQESQAPFGEPDPRSRIAVLGSRIVRDRVFRSLVVRAYESRCAVTGLKLINGGGRAEVEAAHIRPVEADGPDIVSNGLALSGTVHWMFDRGLIGIADDRRILLSRTLNDPGAVRAMINRDGHARLPLRSADRPHPKFLAWHREHCFKS